MGKVLDAMKKSAGHRPPATPATPATTAETPAAAAQKVAAPAVERASKLDAVHSAVQQATRAATEKLTGRSVAIQNETQATPAAEQAADRRSQTVIQAVAAGETVIRPRPQAKAPAAPAPAAPASETHKTRITPSFEDVLTHLPKHPQAEQPAAPKSAPAPRKVEQPAQDVAAASGAVKSVSRAINRADALASVRARRGPVASRESHYFSPLVVTHNQPRCQISEQFRQIRTALIRLANRGPVRCMITSSQPREGKTVTAVNLAYCFSEVTKKRTLLIDADLRRGRVADLLGMGHKHGLSELLNGDCSIEEATWSVGRPNFHVITAGAGSIDQIGEMLSGEQAEQVMTNLTRMYDNIIIDSPPVISVADPAILCRWVDMALMAVRIHATHCNLIEQATQILEGVGVHVTGLIALDEKSSQRNYYRYVNYT